MNSIHKNKSQGFTLLELTLVILLISLLAFVSYGWYRNEIVKAHVAELVGNIDAMRTAFQVERSSGEAIPDFGTGKPGVIPPQLSNLAIHSDMLTYPNLSLLFTYQYLPVADDHVFLTLLSRNERGAESLRALASAMPPSHFIWIMEPIAAMVPMIDEVHAAHALPQPGTQSALPQPVKVVSTPLTQPPVAQPPVAQPPVAQPPVAQPPATQPVVAQTVAAKPQVAATPTAAVASNPSTQTSTSTSGGSGSPGGSGGSGSSSTQNQANQWVPPGQNNNCHNHGKGHGNGNGNNHGHGNAYGHC